MLIIARAETKQQAVTVIHHVNAYYLSHNLETSILTMLKASLDFCD